MKGGYRKKTLIVLAGLLGVKLAMLAMSGLGPVTAMSPLPASAQESAPAAQAGTDTKGAPLESGGKDSAKDRKKEIKPGFLDIEILQEVDKRQKEMDKREEELKRKEERLNALQADLDKQINELKAAQAKIEDLIKERGDLEDEAVKRLAKTYSSMPPENAAALLQQLDYAIAVRVLTNMKERNAARVLAVIPKDAAAKLSEGLVKKR